MKIAVFAGHVGSEGLVPSGQHGGGELHTFAFLQILNKYYDTTAVVMNGVYPAFDQADQYGLDLSSLNWKPIGDSADWLRGFDVLMSIDHGIMMTPICRRNILVTFFPQYPRWDVSEFDTIIANSNYTAKWVKQYWAKDAEVIYPPIALDNIFTKTANLIKQKRIVCIGRFFEVPEGNNKNHMVILRTFQEMMRPDFELVFIGAVQNQAYYQRIREAAGNDQRIKFLHNLSRDDYLKIIGESTFIWSATGYESQKPSSREHFGIFAAEAMATGAIPIVHVSGGTPESGALTWETPQDLIKTTLGLMDNFDELSKTSKRMIEQSQRFSMQETEKQLIDVIEKPLALENTPGRQFKIFVPELKASDVKVGIMSDAPITTGFGMVTRAITHGLLNRGFRVSIFGMQDPWDGQPRLAPADLERIVRDEVNCNQDLSSPEAKETVVQRIMGEIRKKELTTTWRGCRHDPGGWEHLGKFLDTEKPDVLYLNYDPGNVRSMIDTLRGHKCDLPLVAYLPIEGKPIIPQYIELLRMIRVLNGQAITYTHWGAEAIYEAGGPRCKVAHHGVDHADFRPLPQDFRKKLRFSVGWQDKIVLMAVGRNKRTKGFGTLIQVAKRLKADGHNQFVWYLHTNPHDTMANSSMPLDQLAHIHGVDDVIYFPPDLDSQLRGIPYDEPINRGPVPDTNDIKEVWKYNLSTLSMIERYNLADLYINLSELEGFGLPPLEAAGCGLPIISVDDEGVIRECLGSAPVYIPVKHWDPSWHTGSMLAQVNPEDVVRAILDVSADKKLLDELSQESLKRYQEFKWDKTVDIIAKTILEQVQ